MFQLEQVHLVQFFLFQAQTLHFQRATAIIAPNGAGKSALLDALQIVMLGADNRHLRFNAQAGGQFRARTIRDYCLGVYRPGDSGRARDTATTYITLAFRHTDTGEVLSAGVALGASADEADHRMYGLYLLPGVTLSLDEHLETRNGQQMPLLWQAFREQAVRRCKAAGTQAAIEARSERFVRDLLYRLRPQGGHVPELEGYRKALRNALNLKNEDDIDLFVRTLVAEDRPTDVARFRNLLETFRQIKEKIDQVVARIAEAEVAERKYDEVGRRAVRASSYAALAAEYERDAHSEQVELVGEQLEVARNAAADAERTERDAAATLDSLRQQLQDTELSLRGMAGYAGQANFEQIAALERDRIAQLRRQLTQEASELGHALTTLTAFEDASLDRDALAQARDAWQGWYRLLAGLGAEDALEAGAIPLQERLQPASAAAQPALRAARDTLRALGAQVEAVRHDLQAKRTNQTRLAQGHAELRDDVARLVGYLDNAGIAARPVSDLVRVTDPAWQKAIEAYLRRNVDALLVAESQEERATSLYRKSPGLYGVKIVQSRQLRRGPVAAPKAGDVAALLEGDADAVAFLRKQLGDMQCLDSDRELIDARAGLTRDGMLVRGGSIERLRLPAAGELRIGGGDQRTRLKALREDIEQLAQKEKRLRAQYEALEAPLRSVARLERPRELFDQLQALVQQQSAAQQRIASEQARLLDQQDPDLLRLSERRQSIEDEHRTTNARRDDALRRVGELRGQCRKLEELLTQLQAKSDEIERRAIEAFRDPDVDPNLVDRQREELDSKFDDLLQRRDRARERANAAQTELARLLLEAWPPLQQYAKNHSVPLDLQPDDWRGARTLLAAELQQLRDTELVNYQQQADTAYRTAVDTFRSSVAHTLHDNFTRLGNQVRALNATLRRSPPFSNNERYEFRREIASEYAELHKFIVRAADLGETDTLFGSAGEVPQAFRDIVEDQANAKAAANSPLDDYRRFFTFEVVIKQDEQVIGTLSERMRSGSGGEHRAPLYVIAGAALAAAYGKGDGRQDGLGLILLDEFGDKIDAQNARATTDYLRSLGLQLVVAAPDTAQGTLTGVLDSYVELFRDGPLLQISHVAIGEAGRALMESDQFSLHPELLDAEVERILAQQRGDADADHAGKATANGDGNRDDAPG